MENKITNTASAQDQTSSPDASRQSADDRTAVISQLLDTNEQTEKVKGLMESILGTIENISDEDPSLSVILENILVLISEDKYADLITVEKKQELQEIQYNLKQIQEIIQDQASNKHLDFGGSSIDTETQLYLSNIWDHQEKITKVSENIASFYSPEKWIKGTRDGLGSPHLRYPLSEWQQDTEFMDMYRQITDPEEKKMSMYTYIEQKISDIYHLEDLFTHAQLSDTQRVIQAQSHLASVENKEIKLSPEQKALLLLAHYFKAKGEKAEPLFHNTALQGGQKLKTLIDGLDPKDIPTLVEKIMHDETYISLKDELQRIIQDETNILTQTLADTQQSFEKALQQLLEKCEKGAGAGYTPEQAQELAHNGFTGWVLPDLSNIMFNTPVGATVTYALLSSSFSFLIDIFLEIDPDTTKSLKERVSFNFTNAKKYKFLKDRIPGEWMTTKLNRYIVMAQSGLLIQHLISSSQNIASDTNREALMSQGNGPLIIALVATLARPLSRAFIDDDKEAKIDKVMSFFTTLGIGKGAELVIRKLVGAAMNRRAGVNTQRNATTARPRRTPPVVTPPVVTPPVVTPPVVTPPVVTPPVVTPPVVTPPVVTPPAGTTT